VPHQLSAKGSRKQITLSVITANKNRAKWQRTMLNKSEQQDADGDGTEEATQ
jgi:hypothetical protein